MLADFFMQNFVNRKVRVESCIQQQFLPDFVYKLAYKMVGRQIEKFNKVGSEFRYFNPFKDILRRLTRPRRLSP